VKKQFLKQLKPLKRRAMLGGALKGFGIGVFLGVLCFAASGVAAVFGLSMALSGVAAVGAGLCVVGSFAGLLREHSLARVLQTTDYRLNLEDRLASAWEFLSRDAEPILELQIADATGRAARIKPAQVFPFRLPLPVYAYVAALVLAVGANALAALHPISSSPASKNAEILPATPQAMDIAEKLAELEQKARKLKLEKTRRLARELAEAAKKLSEGKLTREQLLARAAEAESTSAVEELAQLAEQLRNIEKILKKSKEWKPIAKSLEQNDISAAAGGARTLAGRIRGMEINSKVLSELQKKLAEASAKSGRRRLMTLAKRIEGAKNLSNAEISKSVETFADELNSMESDKDKLEMLKNLAELARKLKDSATEKMLAQRADRGVKGGRAKIKGLQPGGKKGDGVPMNAGKGKAGTKGEGVGPEGADKPGEGVGSQEGSKKLGAKTDVNRSSKTATIKGTADEKGRDRSVIIKSAARAGSSATGYADIYTEARKAAERAVARSRLPLADQFMVKRYFETIGPAEQPEPKKENK